MLVWVSNSLVCGTFQSGDSRDNSDSEPMPRLRHRQRMPKLRHCSLMPRKDNRPNLVPRGIGRQALEDASRRLARKVARRKLAMSSSSNVRKVKARKENSSSGKGGNIGNRDIVTTHVPVATHVVIAVVATLAAG